MKQVRTEILEAACSANCTSIITTIYELSLSKLIKPYEGLIIYETLKKNPLAIKIGWEFVKNHLKEIIEFYQMPFLISKIIGPTVSEFVDIGKYAECVDFINSNPSVQFTQHIKMSLESIQIKNRWFKSDEHKIINWLKNFT
ncbi:hypothetical protein RF11_04921 [Thelohanellus kitauei]|uniref:Uncharacterized protein n=1 Tax=Thelohanellus kitauei TaxID=669202 RepID=A0A0C2N7N9_THEKT|nr:hypothetical protein RF11_04921 [Thelohanellus kitauei]